MKKWEHKIERLDYHDIDSINKLGQQGWQMTGVFTVFNADRANFYFKREILEEPIVNTKLKEN